VATTHRSGREGRGQPSSRPGHGPEARGGGLGRHSATAITPVTCPYSASMIATAVTLARIRHTGRSTWPPAMSCQPDLAAATSNRPGRSPRMPTPLRLLVYAARLVVAAGSRVPRASRSDGLAALDAVGAAWTISGRGSSVSTKVPRRSGHRAQTDVVTSKTPGLVVAARWAACGARAHVTDAGRRAKGQCQLSRVEVHYKVANVKVTCPHCGHQTWVREHYNDPCQRCGRIIVMRP
jgi:hypothetical protein